ncbi:hypothetical protein AKJ18_28740, partial [Vibrio xuii]
MPASRQLHKFGGSSLANSDCYRRVVNILKEYSGPEDLIVVSAAGKTTNRLLEFLDALYKDGRVAHETLHSLRQFQLSLIDELIGDDEKTSLLA